MGEHIQTYHPINDKKRPLVSDWLEYQGKPEGNYATALSRSDLVIDVDIKGDPKDIEAATQSLTKLEFSGFLPTTKIVKTVNNGFHYYYTKSPDIHIPKSHPDFPGIEFLSYGQGCVGVGSVINGFKYECNGAPVAEASVELLELIRTDIVVDVANRPITDVVEIDEIKTVLSFLPVQYAEDYNLWLKIGMCLHHATSGSKAGLKIWDEFSQTSKKYEYGTCHKKWSTFKDHTSRDKALTTFGTLVKIAMDHGYTTKPGDILPPIVAEGEICLVKSHSELIDEIEDWVFVSCNNNFYNIKDGRIFCKDQLILYYKKLWVKNTLNSLMVRLKHANKVIYWPGKEKIYKEDGFIYINTWQKTKIVPEFGDVSLFVDHLKFLLPTEWEYLRDWMAWVAQNPGKRNEWCVLLTGGQGIGKTFLSQVMQMIVGENNTHTPSNKSLHGDFNKWTEDCELAVVNEIMGMNRLELTNSLKTLINDKKVPVRKMRTDEIFIPVFFNLMLFSNYPNAVLIDDDDRRYGVFHSYVEKREKEYYDRLNKFKDKHIGRIYDYLLSVDLSKYDHFNAPMTESKKRLLEESKSDNFDLIIDHYIKTNNIEIFSIEQLMRHLNTVCMNNVAEMISSQKLSYILRTRYCFLKRVRYNGFFLRLYCKKDKINMYKSLTNNVLIGLYETKTSVEIIPFKDKYEAA